MALMLIYALCHVCMFHVVVTLWSCCGHVVVMSIVVMSWSHCGHVNFGHVVVTVVMLWSHCGRVVVTLWVNASDCSHIMIRFPLHPSPTSDAWESLTDPRGRRWRWLPWITVTSPWQCVLAANWGITPAPPRGPRRGRRSELAPVVCYPSHHPNHTTLPRSCDLDVMPWSMEFLFFYCVSR